MSKKYKEELDKIVMSEDMKKRILHNVLNENIEAKSNEIVVRKYRSFKRNMQMMAACFTVVVCVSVVKNNPQIFKVEDRNIEQKEIDNDKDGENKILPSDKAEQSDIISKNSGKSEDVIGNSSKAKEIWKNENNSSDVASNDGQIQNLKKGNIKENNKNDDNETKNVKNNNDEANYLINNNSSQSSKIINERNDNSDKNENLSKEKQKERNSGSLATNLIPSIEQVAEGSVNKNAETKKSINSNNDIVTKDEINNKNKNEDPQLEMDGNPIKEYKTLEEAEGTVKFNINAIKSMPKGFNIDNLSVISNQIIEITYKNNQQDVINFRAGKEVDNISGDYNTYKSENMININGISIELKGNNNKINLATWKNIGISYSIYSVNGSDEEIMLNMIKSSL